MPFHDWNDNGRDDFFDSFIDYKIISEEENKGSNPSPGNGGSGGSGCISWAIWLLAAYGILSIFF